MNVIKSKRSASIRDVAKKCGTSASMVQRAMKRYGLKKKKRKKHVKKSEDNFDHGNNESSSSDFDSDAEIPEMISEIDKDHSTVETQTEESDFVICSRICIKITDKLKKKKLKLQLESYITKCSNMERTIRKDKRI